MSKKHYIIPIFVPHKGCPFDCVFCNQNRITGVKNEITEDEINKRICNFIKSINYSEDKHIEIAFFGGSFTGIDINKQNKFLEIANLWYKKGFIKNIRISTRPDYINDEILINLKKYNVSIIELGVQSLDEEVLKKSFRGHTSEDVVKASKLIKRYGFKLGHQMMIGLPGDSYIKSIETANKITLLRPDFVRIYPTLVIKGTYLEKMYLEGNYNPLSLEEAVHLCKEIYKIFYINDISVIRIGLQPTDKIMEGKDVIAGPFHPSFRQIVESSIYKDAIELCLSTYEQKIYAISFEINSKNISNLVGIKKSNIKYFKEKFNINKVKIIKNELINDDTIKIIINNSKIINFKKL